MSAGTAANPLRCKLGLGQRQSCLCLPLCSFFGSCTALAYLEGAELLSACPDLTPGVGWGILEGLFLQTGEDRDAPVPARGPSAVPSLSDAETWRAVRLLSWQTLSVYWASHPCSAAEGLLKYPRSPEVALAFPQNPGTHPWEGPAAPSPCSPAS